MSQYSHNVPKEYTEPEWTESAVIHACKSCLHIHVDSVTESVFMIDLADMTGRSLIDMANDTEMKPDSYAWLRRMCAKDHSALTGLKRIKRLRFMVATRIRIEARRRKAQDEQT